MTKMTGFRPPHHHRKFGTLRKKEGDFVANRFWVGEVYSPNNNGVMWVNTYTIEDIRDHIISFPPSFLGVPHKNTEQVDGYIRLTENFP